MTRRKSHNNYKISQNINRIEHDLGFIIEMHIVIVLGQAWTIGRPTLIDEDVNWFFMGMSMRGGGHTHGGGGGESGSGTTSAKWVN